MCSYFPFSHFQYFCFHGTHSSWGQQGAGACGFPSLPFGWKSCCSGSRLAVDSPWITPWWHLRWHSWQHQHPLVPAPKPGQDRPCVLVTAWLCYVGWWISLPDGTACLLQEESRQPALLINGVISRRAWLEAPPSWAWHGAERVGGAVEAPRSLSALHSSWKHEYFISCAHSSLFECFHAESRDVTSLPEGLCLHGVWRSQDSFFLMDSHKNRINLSSTINSMKTCQGMEWIAQLYIILLPTPMF